MPVKQPQERESNFELLRIVAMLGIIIYHLVSHHIDYNRFALATSETGSTFYNLEIIQLFYTFGQLGNTLFILITGYFLITKKNVNVIKPGAKLLNRAYLVAIILLITSYLFTKYQLPISANSNMHMALNGWWFIGYYLFIIVFANYYLNNFLRNLNKKNYLNFILIFLILTNFMEIFEVFVNLKIQNFIIGILVYAVGGFIRLYNPFKEVKIRTLLLILAGFILIQLLQYNVNLDTNIKQFNLDKLLQPDLLFVKSPFNKVLWSPSVLFLSASLIIFELFGRLKLGSIPIINRLSAASFTVYLFHESYFFRKMHFQGIPLPNRLGLLKNVSTKITEIETVPLTDPEGWLNLKDYLNISQVFQDNGVTVGVLYLLLLTIIIFMIGVLLEYFIRLINKLFSLLFSKEIMKVKQTLT